MGALRACCLALTVVTLGACTTTTRTAPDVRAPALPQVELLAWTLIPPEHDEFGTIGGLSGATFVPSDTGQELLFVSDHPERPALVRTRLSLDRADTYTLALDAVGVEMLDPSVARDAEAVVLASDGALLVAYEQPPTVARFVRTPAGLVPTHVSQPDEVARRGRSNRAFESLAIVGDTVWIATEAALTGDGEEATDKAGTRCLVLTDARTALEPAFFYKTEPRPAHLGSGFAIHSLTEFEPLPGGRVLALERSLTVPMGYGARLFLLNGSTRNAPDPSGTRLPILSKRPVANLGDLVRPGGLAWLGNAEALALGPTIAQLTGDPDEEGRLLIVACDDNFGTDLQRTGTQVLALRWRDADGEDPRLDTGASH